MLHRRKGKGSTYVRTYVRVGEKEEETGSRSGSLLHIHTGLKSGPWERRRRTKGRKGGQQSPIIHDTREHGETVVCLDIARGKRAVVRRFCCLLFRFPQIRFVSGTRCSDYQATKKKKKKRGQELQTRLINSERKSCSLREIHSFSRQPMKPWISRV